MCIILLLLWLRKTEPEVCYGSVKQSLKLGVTISMYAFNMWVCIKWIERTLGIVWTILGKNIHI